MMSFLLGVGLFLFALAMIVSIVGAFRRYLFEGVPAAEAFGWNSGRAGGDGGTGGHDDGCSDGGGGDGGGSGD